MARFSILLLLAALSFMNTSEGRSFRQLFHRVWEEANYDNLVLVNTWAPSYCEKQACTILNTAMKNWTIHGLWPYKNNVKNTPIDCDGTYDKNEINDIRSELLLKWPSYKNGGTPDQFWKHEYEKHGTCANDLTEFNSIKKYFQNTMNLYNRYDFKKILANGDNAVRPSNIIKYPLNYIKSALHKGLNVNPAVYCVERKNIQYLWEIRMCFNKNLNAITCGDALAGGGKCNPLKKVLYPVFPNNVKAKSLASSDDLALQFLREMMMDETEEEEEEEEEGELWENFQEDGDATFW